MAKRSIHHTTAKSIRINIWGYFDAITKLLCLSLFFQLGGCGILGVGIWLAVTQGNFATLSSSFPSLSAANLLIVTGTFVMIIGFVGCIGAIKENKCLLLSVSIKPLCFCSDCCLKTPVLFQGMLRHPVFLQKLPTWHGRGVSCVGFSLW